jgi:hypothetical protein
MLAKSRPHTSTVGDLLAALRLRYNVTVEVFARLLAGLLLFFVLMFGH